MHISIHSTLNGTFPSDSIFHISTHLFYRDGFAVLFEDSRLACFCTFLSLLHQRCSLGNGKVPLPLPLSIDVIFEGALSSCGGVVSEVTLEGY